MTAPFIKTFLFLGVQAQHVKVSHGVFVGLPSITGLTGLSRAFCLQLAGSLGLEPHELQPEGVLLSLEQYQLACFKKGHKPGSAAYEAIPAAWASFVANLIFRVRGVSVRAVALLSGEDLNALAAEVLDGMSLCKGALLCSKAAVNLQGARLAARYTEELDRALAMLPSHSLVLRDERYMVEDMREQGMPLMESMVAATLRHGERPKRYQTFFEMQEAQHWRLVPVMNGYLYLEDTASGKSIRPDVFGNQGTSRVCSPVFTLVRLQTAASLRFSQRNQDMPARAFWGQLATPEGHFCVSIV